MKLFRKYNIDIWLFLLLALNLLSRAYGICFNRIAWDEEQFYFGGKGLLRWAYNFFTEGVFSDISNDLISIYGIAGKYLSAIGLLVHELWLYFFSYGELFEAFIFIRIFSSLIPSLIAVYLLFKLSQKISASKLFQYAVLLMSAFAFTWVETAHYAVPDSLSALAVIWTLNEYLALKKKYSFGILFRLAAALALGFASKINIGLLIWGLLSVWIFIQVLSKNEQWKILLKLQLYFMLLILLIHIPYLFYLPLYIEEISFHLNEFPFIIAANPLIYFVFKPAMGVDWMILGTAILGLGFLGIKYRFKTKVFFMPLVFLLGIYIYLSFAAGAIPRWEIPIIPLLIIFAAFFIKEMSCLLKKTLYINIFASILLVLMILRPAFHIYQFDRALTYNDPIWTQMQKDIHSLNKDGDVFFDYSLNLYSVDDLINSSYTCAVLHDHWWNDLDMNEIPARYENEMNNASFIGSGTLGVRRYIRKNWHKIGDYTPQFYTYWTWNPAINYPVTLYVRSK